jgi:hypothetical protein
VSGLANLKTVLSGEEEEPPNTVSVEDLREPELNLSGLLVYESK